MWIQRLVYIIMLARRCTTPRFTKFKFRAAAESMETFVKPLFTSISDNRRHPKKRIIIESYDGRQKAQIFTYFCGNECHERRSSLKERVSRKTFDVKGTNDTNDIRKNYLKHRLKHKRCKRRKIWKWTLRLVQHKDVVSRSKALAKQMSAREFARVVAVDDDLWRFALEWQICFKRGV